MNSKVSIMMILTVLVALFPSVLAFQTAAGTPCTVTNSPCQYIIADRVSSVLVNGFCAPNGFCGDNGAFCTGDDNCYDFCGSDSKCGGIDALCNTGEAFTHGQILVGCNTPATTCANGGVDGVVGTCISSASGLSKTKRSKTRSATHETRRNRKSLYTSRQDPVPEGYEVEDFISRAVIIA